ncbi:MAG: TIGR02594 family protein [Hyphomicrobiaceae bacterium]
MPSAAVRQPAWLDHAWAELGQREIAGRASNTRIADYIRRVGHPDLADDATPWCAAFVGACLERAGIGGTGSLRARSYLAWGVAATEPEWGAIAVLSRGCNPDLGHVGFLVGVTEGQIVLLGGNQSDAVTVEAFAKERLLGFRLPAEGAQSAQASEEPRVSGFDRSLASVLASEGGYSEDPYDPGGPTNKGITIGDYAAYKGEALDASSYERLKAELRAIPDQSVAAIYHGRYWQPARCPELPSALAHFHFDAAVNQGVSGAARMLQESLEVASDGQIGPVTLAAARSRPVRVTLERYAKIRRRRYRALSHFWRFGRGWLARVDRVLAEAQRLANQTNREEASLSSSLPDDVPQSQSMESMTMADDANPAFPTQPANAKWWGSSLTIWGTLVTALSTVAPAILAVLGFDVSSAMIERLGGDVMTVAQAVAGLIGTIMTIVGRSRAAVPLMRRPMSIRV